MSETIEKEKSNLDFSSLFSALLSNPETLSKVSNIIGALTEKENGVNSPLDADNTNQNEPKLAKESNNTENKSEASPTLQNIETNNAVAKLPEILAKFSSSNNENSLATKQQIALLLAIRPYLSEHRRELIDTFIKMNRLGAIFKNLT